MAFVPPACSRRSAPRRHVVAFALLLVSSLSTVLSGCAEPGGHGNGATAPPATRVVARDDLARRFADAGFEGAFVMLDPRTNTRTEVHGALCRERLTPASTFKVLNAVACLDAGVATGPEFLLPWDGVKRSPAWDKDLTLRQAFRVSAVWYFQELARRMGAARMQAALDGADYGNRERGGSVDAFWLDGSLRITAEEQVDFLRKLHERALPFDPLAQERVLEFMELAVDARGVLRGKTGWAARGTEPNVGWFVGFHEEREADGSDSGRYLAFALVLRTAAPAPASFQPARRALAERLLADLGHAVPGSP